MNALHFSSPFMVMHSSRAAFVSGHAQHIFIVGFLAGGASCALEPEDPMVASE